MPCPRFERQGTAESFGRAPACFTERVKKRGHRLPGVRNNRLLEQAVCFFGYWPNVILEEKGMPQKYQVTIASRTL